MALQYLLGILHEVHEKEAREQRQKVNPKSYILDDKLKPLNIPRVYDDRFKNMGNPLRR